jgi:hypothetical protein
MNTIAVDIALRERTGNGRRVTDFNPLAVWWPTLALAALVIFAPGIAVGICVK